MNTCANATADTTPSEEHPPATGYHPSIADALIDFEYDHLPCESLRAVSSQFHQVAHFLADTVQPNPHLTRALHRLTEAKDLAVRSAMRNNPNNATSAPAPAALPLIEQRPAKCCRETEDGTGPEVSAFV